MAIFDWLKRDKPQLEQPLQQIVLPMAEVDGPTYFSGITTPAESGNRIDRFEWRRKLCFPSGETKFKIKYYRQLHQQHTTLIVATEFAPALVFAEALSSGEKILLFDGCKHGYNAMFCDEYTPEQLHEREPVEQFKDKKGNETFEILVSVYYQMNAGDFLELIDENGDVELLDGTKTRYEVAWRNAYDMLQIWAINEYGEKIEILSEELA